MNGHWWIEVGEPGDGDTRCGNCDCRPWGRWAQLPCGTTEVLPPATPEDRTRFVAGAIVHAAIAQMIAEDVAAEVALEGGQP